MILSKTPHVVRICHTVDASDFAFFIVTKRKKIVVKISAVKEVNEGGLCVDGGGEIVYSMQVSAQLYPKTS